MQAYRLAPAEMHQVRLDTAQVQLDILQIALQLYRKKPTEALENQIKEIKGNYDAYKKLYNL